jgi:hypothetical protein
MSLLVKDVLSGPIRMRQVEVKVDEEVHVYKELDGSISTGSISYVTSTVTEGGQQQPPATSTPSVQNSPVVAAVQQTPAAKSTTPVVTPTSVAQKPLSTAQASSTAAAAPSTASTSGSKKGLLYDNAGEVSSFFQGLGSAASAFSWSTNWNSAISTFPSVLEVEQVPQLWGLRTAALNGTDDVATFEANLPKAKAAGATHIMCFNEPDQYGGGGSQIPVAQAQQGWRDHIAKYHGQYTLVSPGVTNDETDPNKGLKYLSAFLAADDINETVDVIACHWYGGSDNDIQGATSNLLSQIDAAIKVAGKRPVWLTEFQYQGTDQAGFIKNALPQLDQKAGLERYAYNLAGGLVVSLAADIASS